MPGVSGGDAERLGSINQSVRGIGSALLFYSTNRTSTQPKQLVACSSQFVIVGGYNKLRKVQCAATHKEDLGECQQHRSMQCVDGVTALYLFTHMMYVTQHLLTMTIIL